MRYAIALFVLTACSQAATPPAVISQPETSTGFREVPVSRAASFMVATANPESTRAAVEILRAGGTAIDAAVAAQMVLTVVEPQSSGVGGGAFLLYYDAEAKSFTAYDGREVAPAGMRPDVFLDEGEPMPFLDAVVGGLSVGVPGAVQALSEAHKAHGTLDWSAAVAPAIALARDGWKVHPRLANALETVPEVRKYVGRNTMFFDAEGEIRDVGEEVKNPKLASSLEQIAATRGATLYRGPLAEEIVAVVSEADPQGLLTAQDLDEYEVLERSARCEPYREFKLCGFPAPAGSLVAVTLLKLLERFDLSSVQPLSAEYFHLYSQASELAYADRDRYYGDPDFVDVPMDALLAPKRISLGSRMIQRGPRSHAAMEMAEVAVERVEHPLCKQDTAQRPSVAAERPSTSHMSIIDQHGNTVSMTASVEHNFGSRTFAGGFVLNNQLTDFEFQPCEGGRLKANAAQAKKRPRSSMSPIIVLDEENRPILAVGSPGGPAIISYTAQTILAVLDWGMDPQDAVQLPNLIGRAGVTLLEEHPLVRSEVVEQLKEWGHQVQMRPLTSGISVIYHDGAGLSGGADPRRDGVAAGD